MKKLYVEQYNDGSLPPPAVKHYQVTKVVNAVHPCVGDILTVLECHDFCDSNDWEVTIT